VGDYWRVGIYFFDPQKGWGIIRGGELLEGGG
jgi:hypothetical protein